MPSSKQWVSETFRKTPVTLGEETHTVEEWCVIKSVAIELVYTRRKRFTSWVDALRPPIKLKDNTYAKNNAIAAKDALALRERKLKAKVDS